MESFQRPGMACWVKGDLILPSWCIICQILLKGGDSLTYTPGMDDALNANLGKNILRFRKLRQWTQRDLGDLLKVDHSMVARWENGKVFPRSKTIHKIAEALEVTVDDLLTDGGGAGVSRIQDPELVELLSQIPILEPKELEALKTVLSGMLTRHQLRRMMGKAG